MKYELIVYQYDIESNSLYYQHSYECETLDDVSKVINELFTIELRTTYLRMEMKKYEE